MLTEPPSAPVLPRALDCDVPPFGCGAARIGVAPGLRPRRPPRGITVAGR